MIDMGINGKWNRKKGIFWASRDYIRRGGFGNLQYLFLNTDSIVEIRGSYYMIQTEGWSNTLVFFKICIMKS